MFPPCLPCRWSHLLCEGASEFKGGPLRREGEAAVGGQAHSQAEAASFSRSLQTPDKSWYSFHWKLNGVHSSAFRKKNNMVDLGKLGRHRWDSAKHKVEGKVLKCHSESSSYTYENPMMNHLWLPNCLTVLQWGFPETMCFIFISTHPSSVA